MSEFIKNILTLRQSRNFTNIWEVRVINFLDFIYKIKSNRSALLGCCIIGVFIIISLIGKYIMPYDPIAQNLNNVLQPISNSHWFGTDELGRDILSRVIYGSHITLFIVFVVSIITIPLGLTIGMISGYSKPWLDNIIMRFTDIFLSMPKLILALALVVALGPGLKNTIIVISLISWTPYAKLVRSETIKIKQADYIKAIQIQGASSIRIMYHHILPMCLPMVFVRAALDISGFILTAAGLGFLGLGLKPPTPEWGTMLSTGRHFIINEWWLVTFPGIAIFMTCLGFNLLADGLHDILNKREQL